MSNEKLDILHIFSCNRVGFMVNCRYSGFERIRKAAGEREPENMIETMS